MKLSPEEITGLNTALNEAEIIGVKYDPITEVIKVTFLPVTVDKDGKVPEDRRVLLIFKPVGRIAAIYRMGKINDTTAAIIPFEAEKIGERFAEFPHLSIYGWDFIGTNSELPTFWGDQLSCDCKNPKSHGLSYSIDLFLDGLDRNLRTRIWFDDIEIYNPKREPVALQDFIDNGKRGWDAINNKDEVAKQFGIFPIDTIK
jgi:hypothetical protein